MSTLLDASRKQVNEMVIVARLGLAGVEGVRLAHNLLPKQYGSRRNQLAAIIVNSFLPPTQQVSEADCGVLLSFMEDRCSDYCNLKPHHNLQQLSLRECLPFEEFLAPPVDVMHQYIHCPCSAEGDSWISINLLLSLSMDSLVHEEPPNSVFDA